MDTNECTRFDCTNPPTWLGYLVSDRDDGKTWTKRVGYCDEHVREVETTAKKQGMTLDVARIGEQP